MLSTIKHTNTSNQRAYDVAIIGGGVVGCAMARRFALEGARVILIEKGDDILSGASKANSAILHTGFDAPADSIELACMKAGYQEYLEIHEKMNLPLLKTSAMVAAWTEEDESKLTDIVKKAHANGVANVSLITRAEVLKREPKLSQDVRAAVLVPDEHVIDPWSAPLAYLQQAVLLGAQVRCGSEVKHGEFDGKSWMLVTARGVINATTVINCAGLFGDELEKKLLGHASFVIRPRKGQFVVFDKPAAALLNHIILPVPSEHTKGIVLCRTIFGNVLVGPTAEEQEDRHHATLDKDSLQDLIDKAIARLPELRHVPVVANYAGLRPASEQKDYRIQNHMQRNWISVGGIRSTGLTAALGIAQHVYAIYGAQYSHHSKSSHPWPTVPNLAEHLPRDWQTAGYQEMICHCELVTRREVEAVLNSPLPPGDLGGLKRRTRVCMGRCQGFYCSARVAELSDAFLAEPLSVGGVND